MVSIEVLLHFRCQSCDKWWSVADAPIGKEIWYCTWCGTKHHAQSNGELTNIEDN